MRGGIRWLQRCNHVIRLAAARRTSPQETPDGRPVHPHPAGAAPHLRCRPAPDGRDHRPGDRRGQGRGGRGRHRRPCPARSPDRRPLRPRRCDRPHREPGPAPRGDPRAGRPGRGPGPRGHWRGRGRRRPVGAGRAGRGSSRHRPHHAARPRVPRRGRPAARAVGWPSHERHAPRRRLAVRAGRHRWVVARPGHRAQDRAARDHRCRCPTRAGDRVGQGGPGRRGAERPHPQRRHRGHGAQPAGVPPAPAARRHPQRARRGVGRGGPGRAVPGPPGRARPARRGAQRHRARDRPPRTDQPPGGRARVDPHLARHHHRAAVGRALRGPLRPGRCPCGARRRPHRSRRGEGPHRRGAGRAQAPRRAGSRAARRDAAGPGPGERPARR